MFCTTNFRSLLKGLCSLCSIPLLNENLKWFDSLSVYMFILEYIINYMHMHIYMQLTFILIFVFLLLHQVLHGVQIRKCYSKKQRWFYIIPGGLAAATGLIIFAFLENDDNYPYTHSVWHITIASSIVFLLPQRDMQPCLGKGNAIAC